MATGVRRPIRITFPVLLAILALARTTNARQLSSFQHGAQGTAQAGALTGSVADASAVTYNPAALARLAGFQLQIGLDRNAQVDTFSAPPFGAPFGTTQHRAEHPSSWLPAVYAAWTARGHVPWSVGVGVDSPAWLRRNTPATFFPVRLRHDLSVRVTQIHSVAAVAIERRWSVGAGVRYLQGTVSDTYDVTLDSGRNPGTFFVRGERSAEATAADWAADLSLAFRESRWGFGAVLTSGATLNGVAGSDDVEVRISGPSNTARGAANAAYLRNDAPRDLGIDLPPEIRGGVWLIPWRALRLETNLAFVRWSSTDWLRPREQPICGPPCRSLLPREWRDTLSLRVGAEAEASGRVRISGGFAYEPSPVRSDPIGFGLPLGATHVFAGGLSLRVGKVSLDGAYSFHIRRGPEDDTDDRYSSHAHIVATSIRFPW